MLIETVVAWVRNTNIDTCETLPLQHGSFHATFRGRHFFHCSQFCLAIRNEKHLSIMIIDALIKCRKFKRNPTTK